MKELSIKEKAKAYDEAKARMSRAYNSNRCTIGFMNEIFPELKESDDERIKEEIINYFKCQSRDEPCRKSIHDKWIAWIEKQGQTFTKEDVGNANKVEPKFKDGDWVFIEEVKGYKNGPFQIKNVDSFGYSFDEYHTIPFMYEDLLSKWTIEDAKDGDMLVASDDSIFLFKGRVYSACKHYVALTTDGAVKFNEGLEHYWETVTAVHPATKEQRNTLIKAIADAGYTFDFEKKELNKNSKSFADGGCKAKIEVEQNPAWSEEDEKRIQRISDFIWKNRKGDTDDIYQQEQDVKWLKSLRLQKQWKPSEKQIMCLQDALSDYHRRGYKAETLETLLKQLKQL